MGDGGTWVTCREYEDACCDVSEVSLSGGDDSAGMASPDRSALSSINCIKLETFGDDG